MCAYHYISDFPYLTDTLSVIAPNLAPYLTDILSVPTPPPPPPLPLGPYLTDILSVITTYLAPYLTNVLSVIALNTNFLSHVIGKISVTHPAQKVTNIYNYKSGRGSFNCVNLLKYRFFHTCFALDVGHFSTFGQKHLQFYK